ncbi:nitroreductase family protein [bacterium]|nr:nitroreductase family protein [bacterium]
MNFSHDVFFNTRSVRKYTDQDIPIETVDEIIKMAGQAPSGLNKQPWLYTIVKNIELKEKIKKECEKIEIDYYKRIKPKLKEAFLNMNLNIKKKFLTEAPYLVCVFAKKDTPYFVESTWLSIAWFILAANSFGLSTLTYTPERMGFLNSLLDISSEYLPQVILPLGFGEKKGGKQRKATEDIIRYYE